MILSGGRAGHLGHDPSGVRNSRALPTDPPVVLPRLPEKFELTGFHAQGAMCEVFKAHHAALDIAVAVKVLRPEYARDPRYRERMRIEAQVLPRLRSRHVVHCFDCGFTDDDRPCTVLEFLRGETLEALLERAGPLDEPTTVELGSALLEALAVAHAHGVVHRDVTLGNLVVHEPDGEPPTLKLIDFGFAWITPDAPESAPEPAESPECDLVVGTPRFIAPEVVLGQSSVDARADLYSAGVVLYSLLAGRDPFAELRTPEAVLEAHAHRAAPPLSRHAPGVSRELERVVMRLLQKNPRDRFAAATEAARALLEAREVSQRRSLVSHPTPSRTSNPPRFECGANVGPYVVTRLIDDGGLSDVYEAETANGAPKRVVALKIPKRDTVMDAPARMSLIDVARQLATIRHPNVPVVHRAGEHEGVAWLSMDLVPGTSLRRHIKHHGRLAPAKAITLAYGIAGALRQIHRLGVSHGGLSTGSVMVMPSGEACVLPPIRAGGALATRSASGGLVRAAHDALAERLAARELDPRADIDAFGVVLFEMLTGRPAGRRTDKPHASTSRLQTLLRRLKSERPNFQDAAPDIPNGLWDLVVSAADERPSLRCKDFSEICAALDEAFEQLAVVHPAVATPSHALAVNGNVLVHLWRGGAEAGARDVSELFERNRVHVGAAALVVVEKDEARSDAVTRAELELLSTTLASRTSAVAVVLDGDFTHAAAPALARSTSPPQPVPIAAFTSIHTATDWLTRCQPRLAGLSDLTGVFRALRRQPSEGPRSTAPIPLRPSLTSGAGSEFAVLEIDEDHVKAMAFNMLFMAWRRRTLAASYRQGIDYVHKMSRRCPEGIAVCQVVEVDAVPPDSETRSMFVEFLRLPHVKQFSVTHEGVGFKAASVRAIVSSVHALARPKCEHGVFAKLSDAARWHEALQLQIGHHEPSARIEHVMQSIRKLHRERYP